MAIIGFTTNLLRKKPVKMPKNLLHSLDLKFYSKSGQNAIVMRFCPLCLFSQLRFI